jgi:hemerythrin-like domain-containing protein
MGVVRVHKGIKTDIMKSVKWKKPATVLAFVIFLSLLCGMGAVSFAAESPAKQPENKSPASQDISPAEDLMREHGILSRILLIYKEIVIRLDNGKEFPLEILRDAASITRSFVEDYHEKLEEDYIFPRFENEGKLKELVATLRRQHDAGRRLTDEIVKRATEKALSDPSERKKLIASLCLFMRMYRPHKAREDTVLFPAFHGLLSPAEYDKLGDLFEERENALFGEGGFGKTVEKVAGLEKKLGIYDLESFTP